MHTYTQFYPVKGWKRYRGEGVFEFIYPARWLQDQAVTLANQARGVEVDAFSKVVLCTVTL
jgi:hypothetical protein